jgi:hypothetical protein
VLLVFGFVGEAGAEKVVLFGAVLLNVSDVLRVILFSFAFENYVDVKDVLAFVRELNFFVFYVEQTELLGVDEVFVKVEDLESAE